MPSKLYSILKKRFYLMIILFFLFAVIASFLLIGPVNDGLNSLRAVYGNLKADGAKKADNLKNLNMVSEAINSLPAGDIEKLKELLPSSQDIEGLLQIIGDKANNSGLVLKTIDISSAQEKEASIPGVKTVKVAANFTGGNYKSFKNLITAMENNARIFDITSINFAAGTGNYAVNFRAYWFDGTEAPPLKIDAAFFNEPIFKMLQPARRELPTEPKGNSEPFRL